MVTDPTRLWFRKRCQPPNLGIPGNLVDHLTQIWWLTPFSQGSGRGEKKVLVSRESSQSVPSGSTIVEIVK
jgi:hypothetical protein